MYFENILLHFILFRPQNTYILTGRTGSINKINKLNIDFERFYTLKLELISINIRIFRKSLNETCFSYC